MLIAPFFSENLQLHALRRFGRVQRCRHLWLFPFPIASAARRLAAVSEHGLTRAAASVPVLKVDEERWDGDRMIFRVRALGQAATGHVDVEEDHVRVEVTLPWLLQRFAEVAQTAIKNRGRLLLTKRG